MKWLQSRPDFVKNALALCAVLLVSVVGVLLLAGSRAATGATLSLTSPSTTVTPGSNFSVTITEDSGSDPINSIQASLNYNASQLQFVSITEGTAFPTVAATSTSTPGVIRVGRATTGSPVTGVNNVVTVNFKVLAASGNIDLSYDKNFSFVVRSTDNIDVLSTTTGGTYAVSGSSTGSASMNLTPATTSAAVGSTVSIAIRENSGSTLVNSVQAAVDFDVNKLQYMGLTEGGTFTNIAATDSATPGKVRVARSVQAGATGVSGDNPIVTLNFKVLATSGTATLALDKAQSFVVDSQTNKDILATIAGSTVTVTSTPAATSTLSVSPTTGTYAKDSEISVNISADSASKLTTVQSTLSYPASQLQFVGVTEGGVFTTVQRTNSSTAGIVDIIRSIPGGNAGVTGKNPVVTVKFKVLGTSGTAAIAFTNTSGLFDDSGTGTNILNLNASTTASYTLTPGSVTPPPPPPPAGSASLNLSPATGSFTQNSNVSVAVKVTGTNATVNTVQSVINYPASQLQFVSVTNGSVFTTVQRTNSSTAGVVDIIRGLPGGSTGVTGENTVVTVNFKVIGASGNAALTFGNNSAVYDDSGTGTNILSTASSSGATYAITGAPTCSANPGTPGTPTKTASNYTTVTLSWAASSAGSNCTLAGYRIYRDGVQVGDVTSGTSYTDTGLTSGTGYSYTVRAFDTDGHVSAASAAANLTSKTDDMAPTAPAGVTAAAPNASSVNLAWNPSTDFPNPGGVGVQGYKIYRNNATTATYTVTSGTTFIDNNVTASTTYSYTVTSYDKLGNESAPSNIVSARTQAPVTTCTGNPTTPAGLASGSSTLTGVSLSWSTSTAATDCVLAGYRVFRDGVQVGTANGTSFSDNGLAPGTSYNYTVQAYDTNGHSSALSTALTIATLDDTTAPTAPSGVSAAAQSAGLVTLTWNASTDDVAVSAYRVYRGGSQIASLGANVRNYSDTTVTGNTDYSYTVSALDAAGNESTKSPATPNPVHTPSAQDTQAPSAPTGLRVVALSTSAASIAWNASTDNTAVAGYHIYRFGVKVGDVTTTGFTDTNLTFNTEYTYMVKAYDASGNESAASPSLSLTTTQPTGSLIGDLNEDNSVDVQDLSILLSHWREVNVPVRYGDINQDGRVEISDLSILLSHLGDKL